MDRRNFVRASAVAGTLALRGKALAAESILTNSEGEIIARGKAFKIAPFDLEEATLAQLQAGMTSGSMTAHSVTPQYLARIDELNRKGPALHHVIEINPDALAIA